jgi:hypothetical protein
MIPDQVVAWGRAAQAAVGASETALEVALAVGGPESGFDPGAIGRLGELGLDQIRPELWQGLADRLFGAGASLLDPVVNLGTAMGIADARLAASGGDAYDALQPWSTRDAAWPIYQGLASAGVGAGGGGAGGGALVAGSIVPLLVVAGLAIVLLR